MTELECDLAAVKNSIKTDRSFLELNGSDSNIYHPWERLGDRICQMSSSETLADVYNWLWKAGKHSGDPRKQNIRITRVTHKIWVVIRFNIEKHWMDFQKNNPGQSISNVWIQSVLQLGTGGLKNMLIFNFLEPPIAIFCDLSL